MKRILFFGLFFITIFSITSFSQSRGFGLGIILGEPTGISAKYWTGSTTALDFGLGYSFEKNSRMHLHADYLFHVSKIKTCRCWRFPFRI
jgi:hypothetical protein